MPDHSTTSALAIAVAAGVPVVIWGPPGTGKTATVTQLAEVNGLPLEVVIASIREPSDFAGLPFVHDGSVTLAPPAWAVRLVEAGEGIVFFDELSTAPPAVQAAMLRIPIERVVGDLELPADVRVIAAANRQDVAGTWDLSAPTANRFCHLNWVPTPAAIAEGFVGGFPKASVPTLRKDWQSLAAAYRAEIGAFLRHRPNLALAMPGDSALAGEAWPSPRTWEMAADLAAAAEAAEASADVLALLIGGAVGDGAAMEYLQWRSQLDLPDPEVVLANPELLKLPRRNDRAFAVLASVVAVVLANNTPERWEQSWGVVQRYLDAGKQDVAALAARQLARNRPKGAAAVPTIAELLPILEAAGLA